jgi:pre-60S factor REI1
MYDGYELQPGEAPIPLLSCLYCTLTFDSVPSSLSHMHRDHGFFIPFPSHLSSVESLLRYLGEKVGIGHCCVYCSARFGSTQAVRQHMREKSHAKLRLDSEEDEEEYTDYYDFEQETEGQQAAGEDGTATAAAAAEAGRRRLAGISDSGELLMTDGSTIGHRQYARVYQQHVRLVPQPPTPHQQPQEQLGRRRGGELVATGAAGALVAVKGGVRDTGKRYRESWVRKNERRLSLKVGQRNNMQAHYRAQVLF